MANSIEVVYMSGIDTRIYIGGTEVGNVQAISWTVQREKVANYVMGHTNPVGFSRGKRGLGGSMVRLVYHNQKWLQGEVYVWMDDLTKTDNTLYKHPTYAGVKESLDLTSAEVNDSATFGFVKWADGTNESKTVRERIKTLYLDQLPPFTICMINANEAGVVSRAYLRGVEFVNQAGSASVDDINMAESMTFLARSWVPWHVVDSSEPLTAPTLTEVSWK